MSLLLQLFVICMKPFLEVLLFTLLIPPEPRNVELVVSVAMLFLLLNSAVLPIFSFRFLMVFGPRTEL